MRAERTALDVLENGALRMYRNWQAELAETARLRRQVERLKAMSLRRPVTPPR